jgi:hypothetical protein
MSGKWDGEFYSYRAHIDCRAMWNAAYQIHGDPWEGMAWDLLEAIAGDEDRAIKQASLNFYRGMFPHVVCRLELRWQREDLAAHDRYRSLGLEPFNEDQPEVFG